MSAPYNPPHQAPPQIVVQPFASSPSSNFPLPPGAAPPAPQLSTYAPSSHPPQMSMAPRDPSPTSGLPPLPPASPQMVQLPSAPAAVTLPAYDQGDWRTAAEQEKDAYYSRGGGSDDGHAHWANAPPSPFHQEGRKAAPAPILLPPPKAAFASAPNSPMSLKMAQEFGDVSSVKDGFGRVEREGGRGAAEVRKSGLDWARFSMMVKQREGEKESDWLQSKKRTSKKWYYLGWAGTAVVVIIIVAVVAAVVSRKKEDDGGIPKTPSLGGLNDKNVSTGSFVSHSGSGDVSSTAAPTSTSSLLHAISSTTSAAASTSSTSRARVVEDDDEETTTSARRTITTTSSSAAARATTETTSAARAASTTTTTAASTTTTAARSRATSTAAAADEDEEEEEATRRLAKRFGSWTGIEWKQPGYVPDARVRERRAGGNWREIEFVSPRKGHREKRRAAH
ncbi:hypothetical protein JCM6882_004594 [Rhodosporidiobolus microsporus]